MPWARRLRVTASPSRVEVNVAAIPELPRSGWRLYDVNEWPLIGAAPKGYLAYGDPETPDCTAFIAKKGRMVEGGNRECVTEEIISKIGSMLPVRMAKSRLVRLPVPKGKTPDVRFLSQNFIRRGEELLIHGIEIVAQYFNARPEEVQDAFNLDDRKSEQNFYTIHNMVEVFRWFSRNEEEQKSLLDSFARMLAFDALVGAPDRHALNWGVVESRKDPTLPRKFSPLFDTARGLFREHTDAKLSDVALCGTREALIRDYAQKCRPVFGVQTPADREQRCNHFELVTAALTELPDELGRTMIRFIRAVHLPHVETMIRRKFTRIVTPLRISFVIDLLRHRHQHLNFLVEESLK